MPNRKSSPDTNKKEAPPVPPRNGKGRSKPRSEDRVVMPSHETHEHKPVLPELDILNLFPTAGADPLRPGKAARVFREGHGPWGAVPTRSEVRSTAAALLQNAVLPLLGLSAQQMLREVVREIQKDPEAKINAKAISTITGVGQLLAQVGVGFLGTNNIDPADIAKLPPPVFQTVDPGAPLPNGKDG